MSLWSFQGARERALAYEKNRPEAGLSKLNSVRDIEVDVVLGESSGPTARSPS